MTSEYRQALSEVNTIIHYMDYDYFQKIPEQFREFITENMDSDYQPNISKNIPLHKQELMKDTKVLLSLLYRDYWCNKENREYLRQQDEEAKKKYEMEQREKYNPDNVFLNHTVKASSPIESEYKGENVLLIEKEELKWYQKIFKKILGLFKR